MRPSPTETLTASKELFSPYFVAAWRLLRSDPPLFPADPLEQRQLGLVLSWASVFGVHYSEVLKDVASVQANEAQLKRLLLEYTRLLYQKQRPLSDECAQQIVGLWSQYFSPLLRFSGDRFERQVLFPVAVTLAKAQVVKLCHCCLILGSIHLRFVGTRS